VIVLDTHAWIWHVDSPGLLSAKARDAIAAACGENQVYVSSISTWEIYMLTRKGRLSLTVDSDVWVSRCERLSFLQFVPIDNEIARLTVTLPEPFHSDPADRIIVATARFLGAPLVTRDSRIRSYPHVTAIW